MAKGKCRPAVVALSASLFVLLAAPICYILYATVQHAKQLSDVRDRALCIAAASESAERVGATVGLEATLTGGTITRGGFCAMLQVSVNNMDSFLLVRHLPVAIPAGLTTAACNMSAGNAAIVSSVAGLRAIADTTLAELGGLLSSEACRQYGRPADNDATFSALQASLLAFRRQSGYPVYTGPAAPFTFDFSQNMRERVLSIVQSFEKDVGLAMSSGIVLTMLSDAMFVRNMLFVFARGQQWAPQVYSIVVESLRRLQAYRLLIAGTALVRDSMADAVEMTGFGVILEQSMAGITAAYSGSVPFNQTLNMTAANLWTNMTHYGSVLQHILEAAHEAILLETDQREGDAVNALVTTSALCVVLLGAVTTFFVVMSLMSSRDQYLRAEQEAFARKQFVRCVMHDARVPLNAVSMGIDLARNGKGSSAVPGQSVVSVDTELLDLIRLGCNSVNTVLDNILDFERIHDDLLVLRTESSSLQSLLENVEAVLRLSASNRNIHIVVAPSFADGLVVRFDPLRMKQVLLNLLSNSVKFSTDGSSVELVARVVPLPGTPTPSLISGAVAQESLRKHIAAPRSSGACGWCTRGTPVLPIGGTARTGDGLPVTMQEPLASLSFDDNASDRRGGSSPIPQQPDAGWSPMLVVIDVIDHGTGIGPLELDRLFTPFYQAHLQPLQPGSGSGLGLAISQRLARLHGGDVTLASNLGEGTTARVVIPTIGMVPALRGLRRRKKSQPTGLRCESNMTATSSSSGASSKAEGSGVATAVKPRVVVSPAPVSAVEGLAVPTAATHRLSVSTAPPLRAISPGAGSVAVNVDPTPTSSTFPTAAAAVGAGAASGAASAGLLAGPGSVISAGALSPMLAIATPLTGAGGPEEEELSTGFRTPAAKPLTGVHVLVVDDEKANNLILTRMVWNLGAASVLKAYNGRDAVDQLFSDAGSAIQLVCLDRNMPCMNGLETATLMRSRGFSGVILGITADVHPDDQSSFVAAGLDDLLCKPITLEGLRAKIVKHLHGSSP